MAEIALLSDGKALSYIEGLYYICCAKKLGVKGNEEIFEQHSNRLKNYAQELEDAQQRADKLQFKEFENKKFIVEDTTDGLRLVGGFLMWNNK